MSAKQYPLCSSFGIPFSIVTGSKIYLLGYSYYKLSCADVLLDVISYPTREETIAVPQLEKFIENGDVIELRLLLDTYPLLPRLLVDSRGRCNQESHEILFGLLLDMNSIEHLERLYGITISDGSSKEPNTITQREAFGSKASLVHDRINVRRQGPAIIRGIKIARLVGKGSFGVVFEDLERAIMKYGTMTGEYVREILSHCMLVMTTTGTVEDEAQSSSESSEVDPITFVSLDMIHQHLIQLRPLTPITRASLTNIAEDLTLDFPSQTCMLDRIAVVIRIVFRAVKALRDRFMMHLDLSSTNIMYCAATRQVKIIDYGGTIGDDSFFDIGTMVSRVCTRSTRAPEYGSIETLWQRNESSETLSAYYAIMSRIFKPDLINIQPYIKEKQCSLETTQELIIWDAEYKEKKLIFPYNLDSLRRVHSAAFRLPKDRPPLDWLISSGTPEEDDLALQMGIIGSSIRASHIKDCLQTFISKWPKGHATKEGLSTGWKQRRDIFIMILLSRIAARADEGTTCAGLAHHLVPPPYITTRCIALYDALRDIVLIEDTSEPGLVRYMTEEACYPILVNAILYVALAPSKANLVDTEHYSGHPLHTILRAMIKYPYLVSVFLSPITAYILMLLESPLHNDALSLEEKQELPSPENSHRIIRCLYGLRRDRRCQPMYGSSMDKIANFVREYILLLMKEPLVILKDDDWWKFLAIRTTRPAFPMASMENELHVESIIRTWFN